MKIRLALAQIQIKLSQPLANLQTAEGFLSKSDNSQVFLLPELWTSGYDLGNSPQFIRQNQYIQARLDEIGKRAKTMIGGSLLTGQGSEFHNTFTLTSHEQDGSFAIYRKLHLFRLMEEDQFLQPGETPQLVDLPWCKAGLAICYDLRFPELFRQYALGGAGLILLVAEWPQNRIEHFRLLLRARAIENQAFVAGVNCVGQTGQEIYGGCSAVIDPWGNVIAEASGALEELLQAEIDLEDVIKIRQRIPIFQDRRPDIYGNLAPAAG